LRPPPALSTGETFWRRPARDGARRLAHVIKGRRIFTQFSVTDNLLLAAYEVPRGERSARVEEARRSPPNGMIAAAL
jgi:branched-chain amino acid transport system ATP-binding protein